MAKTWVLDSETKGTGAQMVPLEKVLRQPSREPELNLVRLHRPAAAPAPPAVKARPPRRFKVVDVMTRQALVEGADTRETLQVLRRVRSVVDVTIFAGERPDGGWRLLTLAEQRALWDFRERSHGQVE